MLKNKSISITSLLVLVFTLSLSSSAFASSPYVEQSNTANMIGDNVNPFVTDPNSVNISKTKKPTSKDVKKILAKLDKSMLKQKYAQVNLLVDGTIVNIAFDGITQTEHAIATSSDGYVEMYLNPVQSYYRKSEADCFTPSSAEAILNGSYNYKTEFKTILTSANIPYKKMKVKSIKSGKIKFINGPYIMSVKYNAKKNLPISAIQPDNWIKWSFNATPVAVDPAKVCAVGPTGPTA